MLELLINNKRVINVDESWINETNFTRMMWCPTTSTSTIKLSAVTPRLALIAALDTDGQVYFALTHSNTDSDVLMLFMKHLLKQLDTEEHDWQSNTVFLLDGAKYHTSEEMREYFRKMKVQVIYSGPYSYGAAPIELLFGALKHGELNPERRPTGKR